MKSPVVVGVQLVYWKLSGEITQKRNPRGREPKRQNNTQMGFYDCEEKQGLDALQKSIVTKEPELVRIKANLKNKDGRVNVDILESAKLKRN